MMQSRTTQRQYLRLVTMLCLQGASLAAYAEGAVRLFDCNITQQCDAAGACQPASGAVSFRMAPVTLDATGAGQYLLSHGDRQELPMQALSEIGPFVWSHGSTDAGNGEERNTLVISSETQLLWHTLLLADKPVTSVRFLSCTQQQ